MLRSVLLFSILSLSICWWDVGHMLVSKIAQDYLQQHDQKSYDKFKSLVESFNPFTDGRSNTFVEAAVWPDDIKGYGATLFDNYHFLDRIYDPEGIMPSLTDVTKYNNSLNTMKWAMTILKKNNLTNSFERAFMARYLLHVVGDIHQPLHSVQMFNSSKTLVNGDLGGNLINITSTKGQIWNLHSFLDSVAGIIQGKNDAPIIRPLDSVGQYYIKNLAKNIQTSYPLESFGQQANDLNVNTWTMQSYDAAVNNVYSHVLHHGVATSEWTVSLYELLRKRIALGGYRLGKIISTIYV